MKNWTEDFLTALLKARTESQLFREVETVARDVLGFDFCAYCLRAPFPFSNPREYFVSNYPAAWHERYRQTYLDVDPTVRRARRSRAPIVWNDALFAEAPQFWREARAYGLHAGWAQSSVDSNGVWGMLSLARSRPFSSEAELRFDISRKQWLVAAVHSSFTRLLVPKFEIVVKEPLTDREVEVLKWVADGKTAAEISDILAISVDTVNFHIKNSNRKLSARNKTAAVVRAAVLGLLT